MRYNLIPAYGNARRVKASHVEPAAKLPRAVVERAAEFFGDVVWFGAARPSQDVLVTDEDGRTWIV